VRRNIIPTPASTGIGGLQAHNSLQIPQLELRRKEGRKGGREGREEGNEGRKEGRMITERFTFMSPCIVINFFLNN